MAGELSSKADKKWVSQNINRAVILRDGDKIYIPALGETSPSTQLPTNPQPTASTDSYLGYLPSSPTASTSASKSREPLIVGDVKISLNHATITELDSLPGIGSVRAQKIIQGRPYQKTEDLVERKVIYRSLYDKIKNQITP
jgi:competence protein ComEA